MGYFLRGVPIANNPEILVCEDIGESVTSTGQRKEETKRGCTLETILSRQILSSLISELTLINTNLKRTFSQTI